MKYKYLQEEILQHIKFFIFEINNKVDGKYSGKHKSWFIGKSLDFVQHREYSYGDDIKLIDWKIYGRRDKFFIKQFHQETNLEVYFFIDCSASMWYPEDGITKYEYANYICSYLSYIFLNQKDKVGVVKFDNKIIDILNSSSVESFYYNILDFLEKEIKGDYSNFTNVIDKILSQFKKRTLIILMSDLISDDEKITVKLLKEVSSYGIYLFVLHIIYPKEKTLEFDFDNIRFKDIEEKLPEVKTNLVEIKDLYVKEFLNLIDYYNKELNDKNIKYKTIYTSLPILENLKIILE
ncbi:MAG: DUF58 domain-containing protein [Elusimicrobiota bacterium]|nr:DUF58 domain-containing protein [Endomicrobiia bacterium]MDW8165070.1 DUF58 domain-containing protein [Elusimicrobiota bacterium]